MKEKKVVTSILTYNQLKTPIKLQTQVSSSLTEYPIYKALWYIFSLTKATACKHSSM